LNEKFDLIITASEDTKINFFLFSKKNKKIEFLSQSSKHAGAIREIIILSKNKKYRYEKKLNKNYFMFEYLIYSVGALSQSFINKFYILFDENNNFLSHDLEFSFDMTIDNHLKCSGTILNNDKFKDLSYFQNIKKEKSENIETRIMGVAKIELNKYIRNSFRIFFTCAINSLGHCEMAILKKKENFKNSNNELEVYRRCSLLKNNQFIGLTIKLLGFSNEENLIRDKISEFDKVKLVIN